MPCGAVDHRLNAAMFDFKPVPPERADPELKTMIMVFPIAHSFVVAYGGHGWTEKVIMGILQDLPERRNISFPEERLLPPSLDVLVLLFP
jgi:hypothetical protein